MGNYPVRFNDFRGRWGDVDLHGDATVATVEKGEIIFEAAVEGLVKLLDELREWPIEERSNQHRLPAQKNIQWWRGRAGGFGCTSKPRQKPPFALSEVLADVFRFTPRDTENHFEPKGNRFSCATSLCDQS